MEIIECPLHEGEECEECNCEYFDGEDCTYVEESGE